MFQCFGMATTTTVNIAIKVSISLVIIMVNCRLKEILSCTWAVIALLMLPDKLIIIYAYVLNKARIDCHVLKFKLLLVC